MPMQGGTGKSPARYISSKSVVLMIWAIGNQNRP